MCRFTAYLGNKEIILHHILAETDHSLVSQSHSAKECALSGVNGDGFGIGWYNQKIDKYPALFKSTLPAWNDENLKNVTKKISSNCFIGHVRAATVGTVDFSNCHPFTNRDLMFVHNGQIDFFSLIKKTIIAKISSIHLSNIKGQTDSEYILALICTFIDTYKENTITVKTLTRAFMDTITEINNIQNALCKCSSSKLNLLITNGKILAASKYSTNPEEETLSLYYSTLFLNNSHSKETAWKKVFISSEILDCSQDWISVPSNHFLTIDEDYNVIVSSINEE